eukprot:996323-Prymnesium_polylepis.1
MERMEARQSEESQQKSQQDSVVQQLERAQIDEPSEQRAAEMSVEESEAANLASLARNDLIADSYDKKAAQLGDGEPTEWLDFMQEVRQKT